MRFVINQRKFEKTFGFVPTSDTHPAFKTHHVAEQAVVNRKLEELAADFRRADNAERVAAQQLRKVRSPEALLASRAAFEDCRDRLRLAKEAFWSAAELAKGHMFTVLENYSDYLQPELV